jgi:hypothetical protein
MADLTEKWSVKEFILSSLWSKTDQRKEIEIALLSPCLALSIPLACYQSRYELGSHNTTPGADAAAAT